MKKKKSKGLKIFISADIEGITGTTHWDETQKEHPDYAEFQKQMTMEVKAACEGAINAGATEILVADAHHTARNIIASKLPRDVELIRGWSGHPFRMVQHLDDSFDALVFVGYHSLAGSFGNPLAHTINGKISHLRINEMKASEFLLHCLAAETHGVPSVFISGDEEICHHASSICTHIVTVPVKKGVGSSTINLHPHKAVDLIREGVFNALQKDLSLYHKPMPQTFKLVCKYKNHFDAYRASFFPGVTFADPDIIYFETDQYDEVMRLLLFIL